MRVIFIALVCPIIITALAWLVQAYFWYRSVLYPLATFEGSAHLNELNPLFDIDVSDNSSPSCAIINSGSHKISFENPGEDYLKFVIHIVHISSASSPTAPLERRVITSIRKHLLKTMRSIRQPSIDFRVIQSTRSDDELNNLISYQRIGDSGRFIPYLTSDAVDNYVASPNSAYNSQGSMMGCTTSTSCKVLTFVHFIPDFSAHTRLHTAESGPSNGSETGMQYEPVQIINKYNNKTESLLVQPTNVASGLIVPQLGCFSALQLQSKHIYHPVDANSIYSTTVTSVQCLQTLLSIPDGISEANDAEKCDDANNNICSAERSSIIDADHKLTFGVTQLLQYQQNRLALLTYNALSKLQAQVTLHRYSSDITVLMTLTSPQGRTYFEIFELLDKMKATLTVENSTNGCLKNRVCLHTLHTMVRKLSELVHGLDTDPDGGLKGATPMEQYFAIFGPYWLPILVPVYRALKSMTPI